MANEKRLIDAYALWAEFMDYADTGIEFDGEGVANAIANAPTVDTVEVVHGRWIWTVTGEEDYEQYYRCSKCNDHMYSEYNYCPNCGAKMDKEA